MVLMEASRHLGHSPGQGRSVLLSPLMMKTAFSGYTMKADEEGDEGGVDVYTQVPECSLQRVRPSDAAIEVLQGRLKVKDAREKALPSCQSLLPTFTDR